MNSRIRLTVFLVPALVAMSFAYFTDHRWEDWYITYRASKNLALGNGLVFNPGERVHSFTSPIGTVLPALLRVATGNVSDEYVIWIFRVISSCALGGAALLLLATCEKLCLRPAAILFLLAMFSTSILILDFSINGMETAFMMLFLSYLLYTVLAKPARLKLHLAAAMAGLMYTRPDGFVYGGTILLGLIVFNNTLESGSTRRALLWNYFQACLLAVLFYSPWLLATTLYYGSPVPHTIVAKGALRNYSAWSMASQLAYFPLHFLQKAPLLYMPPYSEYFGGWKVKLTWLGNFAFWFDFLRVGRWLTIATGYAWLCPGVRLGTALRGLSLAVFLESYYLLNISGQGGMPWYLPNTLLPSIIVLALVFDNVLKRSWVTGTKRTLVEFVAVSVVAFSGVVLLLGAYQLKTQQEIIEYGNRKELGLWLKEQTPGKQQTVFLECLGYIPFFSELKPYDFPGMSSPEMVAARKKLNTNKYALLIEELQPDWLVLRPVEVQMVEGDRPHLLTEQYEWQRTFDVSDAIPYDSLLLGKPYLLFDSEFRVFKRRAKK